MSPIAMTLVLVSTLAFFSWSVFRRTRQVRTPRSPALPDDPEFDLKRPGELRDRIRAVLVYVFGQRKMPYYRMAGIAHIGIFIAFVVLLLNSIMLWGRGYHPEFDFWGLLSTHHWFGQIYSFVKEIAAALVPKSREVKIVNTICHVTTERQEEADHLATTADVILVVGSPHSSNSRKLVEVCGAEGAPTHQVEGVSDIDLGWFAGKKHVGIHAGASTPREIIQEIVAFLQERLVAA